AVERRLDGEPVVVGGDLHFAGPYVLDGLVDAAMAVAQLVGGQAERPAEELVAEADAEERDPRGQHLAQRGDVGGGGVAGAVGEEHAVGADRLDVGERGGGGQHVHLAAAFGHPARGHALHAEVDGGHGVALGPDGGHDVRLGGGDLGGQVGAHHGGRLTHPFDQRLDRLFRAGEDPGPHGAAFAQVAGERAGAAQGDADDALVLQVVVERAGGPPARHHPGGLAHDVSGDPDAGRLRVLVVDAGVADVGGGHGDDLAVVGGVG